jgi:hypothetical protein
MSKRRGFVFALTLSDYADRDKSIIFCTYNPITVT